MSTIGTRQLEGMWRSARGRTPGADPVAESEKEWAVISESGDPNERYAGAVLIFGLVLFILVLEVVLSPFSRCFSDQDLRPSRRGCARSRH